MTSGARLSLLRRGVVRWLRRGEPSAVSMELGIIAIPFFTMFLGVMEISYDLYVQASLDNAVELAARGVQVGNAMGVNNENSNTFVGQNVCPNLGGLLDCNLLTVAVVPILSGYDYYTLPLQQQLTQAEANNGTGICTGTGGTPEVLVAWYNGPTFLGLLVPAFTSQWSAPGAQNSTTVHVTQASAGFVDEYFPGGQTGGKACGL
jgi:Flp pilus assembly protein TadG